MTTIVELKSFPACRVVVRDEEIANACLQAARSGYVSDARMAAAARNIALGKRAGVYPARDGDIQAITHDINAGTRVRKTA